MNQLQINAVVKEIQYKKECLISEATSLISTIEETTDNIPLTDETLLYIQNYISSLQDILNEVKVLNKIEGVI